VAAATTWRTAILVTTLATALAFGLMLCCYRARGGARRRLDHGPLVDDHGS
jgi:hypothetical protein